MTLRSRECQQLLRLTEDSLGQVLERDRLHRLQLDTSVITRRLDDALSKLRSGRSDLEQRLSAAEQQALMYILLMIVKSIMFHISGHSV